MKKKLHELSLHLLDLGKRNRLLNYKETGYKSLQILNKEIDTIFNKVINGSKLSFFNLDPILEKYKDVIDGTDLSINEYNKGKIYDIASPSLKQNELLAYKQGYSLNKILKMIYKEYKNTLIEKGINPLYLSIGLVKYLDKKQQYFAPLLLIPIDLEYEINTYKIKEYDDEVILNPTLAYLLNSEYKIKLDEYNEEPLLEYLSKIMKVLKKYDFELINHMAIGIYSFLKINMFEDINTNIDEVISNKNILKFLGKDVEENLCKKKLNIYPVVGADESQLKAIQSATNGESFVLQGPPGSGKSQTITNIIASAICNDKKVLFVSEKQAALNVVYENLKKAGLDSFCLELHSHKANKKEFIEELYKTAILPRYDIDTNASDIQFKYDQIISYFDEYRNTINKKIDNYNMSLYDVFTRYISLEKPAFSYEIKNIGNYNNDILMSNISLLERYSAIAIIYWKDYRNSPFFGFTCKDISFVKYKANDFFIKLQSFLKTLIEIKNTINSYLPIGIDSFNELINNINLVDVIANLNSFNNDYFKVNKRSAQIQILEEYLSTKQFLDNSTVKNFLDDKIFDEEISLILNEFKLKQGFFKFLSPRYHQIKNKLNSYCKFKMKDKELINKLEEALEYKNATLKINSLINKLPNEYLVENYHLIYQDLKSLNCLNFNMNFKQLEFIRMKKDFIDALIKFRQIDGVPKYDEYFNLEIFSINNNSLDLLYRRVDLMINNLDLLETHVNLNCIIEELERNNLLDYLHTALDNKVSVDKIARAYEKIYLENLIYYMVDRMPILKEFVNCDIDNILNEFKKLNDLYLEVNKAIIVSKLSKLRPDDAIMAGSEFSILVREYNKSRKQKPIRILLEEITDLILNIKPVFLMSPLSVSTYLNSSSNMFDLVIFDETSQVFAWDAIGAIYRAKQCVIIGDSKQMPPSNFFNSIANDEESDDNDLESILDKGMTVFSSKQLNWHYRSRSEELIAFSNEKFYDSRLVTIPQARKKEPNFGVDFHKVEGVYESESRTNKIEAMYIVDLIVEHYKKDNEQSLGVIAFSNSQAELIEDLLEARIQNEPHLASKIEANLNEPFFIKNLETVQGDERDRIIFSICYGYNQNNKFYQRFGPLNNVGGERRLNVAITRAKYNICVVSSIRSIDISLDNTNSLGVKLLKEYLEYAETMTSKPLTSSESNDELVKNIVDFLNQKGILVNTNIGSSKFKIDIAIMHPISKEYVIALMVDGQSYQFGNCNDQNCLQEILLSRLGWKFYRVFSTRWIINPKFEKEKLLGFIRKVFGNDVVVDKPDNTIDLLIENKETFDDNFEEYKFVDKEEIEKLYETKTIKQIIKHIVTKEEPISIDFLLKRICFMYGRTKVTNIVRTSFYEDLEGLNLIEQDGFLMTKLFEEVPFRINSDRNIDQVFSLELQDAINKIVKRSNGIEKDGCFKEVVKLLGYNRMSDNAVSILENALVHLKLSGKIMEKEGRLYY